MGLMHITGSRSGPPVKVGVAVTDLTTGLYTSNAIMAALLGRLKTSRGQHIDVALSDCQVATLSNIASSVLVSGKPDSGRWGTAHPSIVPYRGFTTRDGSVMLGGGNDRLFGVLCERLGRPEWKGDERFVTNALRVRNRDVLEAMVEGVTRTRTTEEWLEVLEGSGMPYAAINDVKRTLEHEHGEFFPSHFSFLQAWGPSCKEWEKGNGYGHTGPEMDDVLTWYVFLVLARNMVTEVEHPTCGPLKLVNTPVKYSVSEPGVRTPPPTLGQHTDEVLGEVLGMEKAEIEALRSQGAVA